MPTNSRQFLNDVIEWDVRSWSHAIALWESACIDIKGKKVLDLGSRGGGLSYYFAFNGAYVICSDLEGPPPEAKQLIIRKKLSDRVTFLKIDATDINLTDGSCDFVCFKSILGGIGRDGNDNKLKKAVAEIHRVLRPGGILFFAENLQASQIHRFSRKRFVRWGDSWNYLTNDRLFELLHPHFEHVKIDFGGFFSAFGRSETQRNLLSYLDSALIRLIPNSQRYIAFGYAIKETEGSSPNHE